MLDVVLALDGSADIIELFEVNQSLEAVPLREAGYGSGSMLVDAVNKVVCLLYTSPSPRD